MKNEEEMKQGRDGKGMKRGEQHLETHTQKSMRDELMVTEPEAKKKQKQPATTDSEVNVS